MNLVIKKIPLKEQRYFTVGDYWLDKDGTMQVRISARSKKDFYCYALHEFVEAVLTLNRNISWKKIDQFDMTHSELDDPGADKRAPYHLEHEFANRLEEMLLRELNK